MKLIVDTDPGTDDAIALLWALANDLLYRFEIMAVTTTEGKLKRRVTFDNACRLLDFCRRDDIPVARAAPHAGENALHIHGKDGLGGLSGMLPKVSKSFDDAARAPHQLKRLLERAPGEITIAALGPLTNLAAAEQLQPGILENTKNIIVLGGSFGRGNATPFAEFNAHYNPGALQEVLDTRANVVLIPLDITRQLDLTPEHLNAARLTDQNQRITRFLTRLCSVMSKTMAQHKNEPLFFVHAACAMVYALHPELFEAADAHVDIETRGAQSNVGRTIIRPAGAANVTVLRKIDTHAVRATLLRDLAGFAAKLA
ncbi:MAG: nucleoside hydrolase [Gammaproteobacteria bacterium]|nr:nucleoside hydrolase [Gammaproteobacteria bacterium]